MSDQEINTAAPSERRAQIRERVERLRQSRRRSILRLPEIIGLGASALLLLIVLFAYFYSLLPARNRLASLDAERNRLQSQLRRSQGEINVRADTQASVEKINESVENFEANRLSGRGSGSMALYTELNELMRRNALRNTSGPTYVSLDALGAQDQQGGQRPQQQRTGKSKYQSVFPGIGVSLTVEGQYHNLRRFLRELETSKQFVVVNAVELESVKDSEGSQAALTETAPAPRTNGRPATQVDPEGARPAKNPGASTPGGAATPPATTRGALVSLRLDMAVYFRRNEGVPTTNPATR
jgi:Tfp pilus assembly protein PilO